MPLIPILLALVAALTTAEHMTYRSQFAPTPNGTRDVYDGSHYKKLREKYVTVGGHRMKHKFFEDRRDVALGIATDGFSPFKKKGVTSWPILLVNYNLPPTLRFRREHLICVGEVPGPHKPKDMDSFLWFMITEFLQLAAGVEAFDGMEQFMLRAYLILGTGDMPAVAMLMHMLGPTGTCGCRMCSIRGVSNPAKERSTAHYPALNLSKFRPQLDSYHAEALPLRTHDELLNQARKAQSASTKAERKRLATKFGIRDVPALSQLSSLEFPTSFPFGFMHLIFENLIPNMVNIWQHLFDPSLPDDDDFVIPPEVWKLIAEAGASSGTTIPSAFGAKIPNIVTERHFFTAEKWLSWTLFVAPTALCGRFRKPKYYAHFMRLVGLIKKCLQFKISTPEMEEMEAGFRRWVEEYEKYVHSTAGIIFRTNS